MQRLQAVGMPEDALNFYRDAVPTRMAEIGKVRLWNVGDLEVENRDAVPGYYALPCGYVVFASTDCGDSYCFDIRSMRYPKSAPIVLIAHDLEPENDEMKREELEKLAKPIAESFEKFLESFAASTLDRDPVYPPFDFGKGANDKT
jgi:SMI1 / KNR4 family (SUKH-1)